MPKKKLILVIRRPSVKPFDQKIRKRGWLGVLLLRDCPVYQMLLQTMQNKTQNKMIANLLRLVMSSKEGRAVVKKQSEL